MLSPAQFSPHLALAKSASLLQELFEGSIADAHERQLSVSIADLEFQVSSQASALDATAILTPRDSIHVLAEIKRASPSKGDLAKIENPAELALEYMNAGASAISVLTESRRFKGSLLDFEQVRSSVSIPLLRKDFIANEYQVLEARAFGADIVLLIVAGLEMKRLAQLKNLIEELGMTAFVETHNADEVLKAVDLGAKMVGINARDLSTFETDRDLYATLASKLPANVIKVAESAVRKVEDVRDYRSAGADVVLVGEALVTGNPSELIESFLKV